MADRLLTEERIYPCTYCDKLRTKDEGGTIFTTCDECWDKLLVIRKRDEGARVKKCCPRCGSANIKRVSVVDSLFFKSECLACGWTWVTHK